MENQFIISNTIALLSFILFTFKKVFQNSTKPTCDDYITNIYLYLTIWILMTSLFTVILINKYNVGKYSIFKILFIVIAQLGIYIILNKTPQEQQVIKHFLATIFIMLVSLLLAIFIPGFGLKNSAIISTLFMTLMIFLIMSTFGHIYKDKISSKMILIFATILVLFLLLQFILLFFLKYGSFADTLITFITVCLLSIWLIFKTKLITIEAENCVFPNYVESSMSIFIDIKNIFIRLLKLKSLKK